jgi:hypothetical protein
MPTSVLNPAAVERVFRDCLFADGEDTAAAVIAEGIVTKVGFNPDRLTAHADEVTALLDELPDDFKASGGGGTSFLNACNDKHGHQWTGLHQNMEQLFLLGLASGRVESLMPREMWSILPGGMPFYVIK